VKPGTVAASVPTALRATPARRRNGAVAARGTDTGRRDRRL